MAIQLCRCLTAGVSKLGGRLDLLQLIGELNESSSMRGSVCGRREADTVCGSLLTQPLSNANVFILGVGEVELD